METIYTELGYRHEYLYIDELHDNPRKVQAKMIERNRNG